ncbi:MAG TPA: hypothetical protein VE398_21350, partial [Acidobacteriota bacterium]|nr:hypothetical protein [Acidobacteriota bacterium]
MKNTTRYVTFTIAAALLGSGAYFYRTLELGRADAQPAMLDILNPAGEFTGPRGIQFDAAGNIYVGDAQGIVWILDQGGRPHVYAQMSRVQSPPGAPPASGSLQVG